MSRENHVESEEKRDAAQEQGYELLDISMFVDGAWKCFKRFWVWFLVVISACASIGWGIVAVSYVPNYVASTTFIVTTGTSYSYSAEYYNKATATQLSKTFPYIISNSALQYLIAEDLGLDSVPGKIEAEALADTNLITIRASADSPQMAYDILQSVLNNYPQVARLVIGDTVMNVVEESGIPESPANAAYFSGSAKRGVLLGAILCMVWTGFYVMGRKTILREEDLKNMLNIRCLAAVPKVQFKKSHSMKKNQIVVDNPRVSGNFKESYRTIRTRIERVMNEKGSKVFLVSSASANEGKTTMAVNLAVSLAQKGKKVVILDLDLRNPSVMKSLGMKESRSGITEVLQGKVPANEVLEKYKDLDLTIIPGGKPVQMPTRLLNSEMLANIIKALRTQADCIILDTPPSGLLSDASQVAQYADEGIFVVRQDFTSVERVKEGIEMLTDGDLHMAGCILNCAEAGITGYGYGYGRYGRYGKYGYND